MVIALSAGISVMIPTPVQVWRRFILMENSIYLSCLLPLHDDSAAGSSGSVFNLTSSVGVGSAGSPESVFGFTSSVGIAGAV